MEPRRSSLWLVLTLLVSTVSSQAGHGHRHCPAVPSPEPSCRTGTAPASVVEELLRDSLDKAYGKQGNPSLLS